MKKVIAKRNRYARRKHRARARISGTSETPRLMVHRTTKHMEAQLIDDVNRTTLLGMSDMNMKLKGTKTERSAAFGKKFGEAVVKTGVKTVVFDRNGRAYHGRVKAFAEAAREAGLDF